MFTQACKKFGLGPSGLSAIFYSPPMHEELADDYSSNRHGNHMRPNDSLQPPYSVSPGRMQTRQLSLAAETE